MSKQRVRNEFIDALKAYACLLVVVGHVLMGIRKMGNVDLLPGMELLEEFFYTFHVALFMFLSGYVYRMTGESTAKGNRIDYIRHKAVNLGIPYIVFSVVYIIVNSVVGGGTNTSYSIKDLLNIWRYPIAQYWFLYSLFFLFLIWALASIWMKNWQITSCVFILILLSNVVNFSFGFLWKTMSMAVAFGLGTCIDINPIKNSKFPEKIGLICLHIIVTIVLLKTGISSYLVSQIEIVLGIVASISLISLLYECDLIRKALLYINSYSFQIYVLHTFFTAGIRIVMGKFGIENYILHVVSGTTLGLVGPIVIGYIAKKSPYLDFFFFPTKNLATIRNTEKRRSQ